MILSGVCKKRKVQQTLEFTELCGGDGGIRTHVPAHHRQNDFEILFEPTKNGQFQAV